MRLIKAQNTNLRQIYGKGVRYDINDQVVVDSENVMLLPKGAEDTRPGEDDTQTSPTDGHVRYNTTTDQLEAYQNGAWRNVRFKEPNQDPGITQQDLGLGDADKTLFGPLDSGDSDFPQPAAPQNILVFVENVFQLANINYEIIQNPAGEDPGYYLDFFSAPDLDKPVTVLHNFDK